MNCKSDYAKVTGIDFRKLLTYCEIHFGRQTSTILIVHMAGVGLQQLHVFIIINQQKFHF